jgi:photosystem II stability/assembly factor-like uncharacterized protein
MCPAFPSRRAARSTGRAIRPRGYAARSTFTTFATLALLAVLPAAASHAQSWTPQSPIPTSLDVRGMAAPTTNRVFIATEDNSFDNGGALFESQDGGATWIQRDVPASLFDPLHGVFFLDAANGWAFGNANYRTTDGGNTWEALPFLGSTYAMRFYTSSFGSASGNGGNMVSLDGGLTWDASPNDMFAFDFMGPSIGLGVSASGIYRTTNGGTTFDPVRAGDALAVAFLSSTGAVAIVDGIFVSSDDGGVTWTNGPAALGRTRLTAVSAGVVLAWGRGGAWPDFDDRVLRSVDGGQTWSDLGEILNADDTSPGFGFTVVDPQTIVASNGEGDLLRSTDAGASWSGVFASVGPRPSFFHSGGAPVFASSQTGYFAYGPGFVLKTSDGGATWTQVSSGTGASLADIARLAGSGENLIAVGANGTVVTRTGSAPWVIHPRFTELDLAAVDAVGNGSAVTVDHDGRVHRTSDGGATWTSGATTPEGLQASDLDFTTPFDGWVVGHGFSSSAIFHTTDGGDSWTSVADVLGTYVAVDFEGTSGWAANVSGSFYRTTDGGATWTGDVLPGSAWVQDMDFFDQSRGYAVGANGYAARSDDGGITWVELPIPSSSVSLTDIELLGPNELWVSTNDNVAYHSATAGMSWTVLSIGSPGFGSFAAITGVPGGGAWTVGYQGAIGFFPGPPPPPANQPPVVSFTFGALGLSVVFTDQSSDADGSIVSWLWDFGDGTGSSEPSPTHVYASANTYIVRLTVTDDDGTESTTGRIVVAQPGPGGTFGELTEVTPLDPLFVTPQDEDFWVITTASADYDGDGDLDVAVLGYYVVYFGSVEHKLVLVRNDGPAGTTEWEFGYVDVPLGALTAGSSDLAWGDPDGDGDQDLAVGTDGETAIYRNDGGTLVLTDTELPGYSEDNGQADFDLRSITWADYDNDGDADLLIPSSFDEATFEYRTMLMRNDGPNGSGGWTFAGDATTLAPTSHAQSSWADFDGDEDLDLLLVNLAPLTETSFIRRYRNDGGGAFVGEDVLGALTVEHGEAQWGDYDSDGDLDILVAGNIKETDDTYTTALRVYRNDAGTYVQSDVIPDPMLGGWWDLTAATWADYDSDGDVDILLAGNYNSGEQIEGRAKIYDNQGGTFVDSGNQLPSPRASGDRGGTFTWLDLDGDGDLDYFIAGQYFVPGGNGLVEAQMHVYRNDAEGANAAPSAPTALHSTVNASTQTVSLSWGAAADDLTPEAALTYDLTLHRNGTPVLDARHTPQPGCVGAGTDWSLAGLPDGQYTWTLRAVDSAYNGSPVAQGAFVIGGVVGVDPVVTLPTEYAFRPSYPNPFRHATTFSIALPERANVKLAVYDLSGRLVAKVLDEPRDAGEHVIPWDASGVASGAYFVRVSAGAFERTQQVVVIQ